MAAVRAAATLLSSTLFAIVAAPAVSAKTPVAIGLLASAYLLVFMLGASYRLFINVWLLRRERVSPTWSGATAASALGAALAALAIKLFGGNPDPVLVGYALAINAAFVLIKQGCLVGGCCGAKRTLLGFTVDLRHIEIVATALILGATALSAVYEPAIAAPLGLIAHTGMRLLHHRWLRGTRAKWWPHRRPGIELVPLYLVSALALVF